MKILFIFPQEKAYNSSSVREYPSGGTEKTVIFLGEALQKLGHEVEWVTETATVNALLNDQTKIGGVDVVITQVAQLLEMFPEAKKIWWTHHFSDQPVIQANSAYGRCFADHIVTLSQCHHDDFKQKLRLNSTIIGHGVWKDELHQSTDKDPYRLIYASAPFRGLEKIPALFKEIKAREPRATIAICSSMGTYRQVEKDSEYQALFDELAQIPGVELKGALNQAQLYAEYSRASIFFYPCIWSETYCLALDEAMAHYCSPLVANVGALQERVPVSVNTDGSVQFRDGSIKNYAENVWSNDAMFPIARNNINRRLYLRSDPQSHDGDMPKDWLEVAKQWEKLFV